MKLLNALVALGLVLGMSQGFAEKKKALVDTVSGQGYGMAGCGLGSIVFGDKPGMIQILAGTTNGLSFNQSFGISSGTLNCGESAHQAQAEQYVEVNQVALQNDIVRGQGETLSSLSQLMDCKNTDFPVAMKKNYNHAFPKGGASAPQLSAVAYKSCQI